MGRPQAINRIRRDIEKWIDDSRALLDGYADKDGKIWVVKYMHSRHLESFLIGTHAKKMRISDTIGFTWGTGVYVTPLQHPRSTMMFGRIALLGYIDANDIQRPYDARHSQQNGVGYFLQWAQSAKMAKFMEATTNVYPHLYLHDLKQEFCKTFNIDFVCFEPDELSNRTNKHDIWFNIKEANPTSFSDRIKEVEWVAIVGEEYELEKNSNHYARFIGQNLRTPPLPNPPDAVYATYTIPFRVGLSSVPDLPDSFLNTLYQDLYDATRKTKTRQVALLRP